MRKTRLKKVNRINKVLSTDDDQVRKNNDL